MGMECMDNISLAQSLRLNIQMVEDMGKNRLVEHLDNNSMEECTISKHLVVGKGRN
jgi:hypothetical protein